MLRTHTCGELRTKHVGQKVTLCGWVDTIREHGRVSFIDLRDRYGKTQIVTLGKHNLKQEFVVKINGEVVARKEGTQNIDIPTGEVEVFTKDIEILNESKLPPFHIDDSQVISDDLRLKYRFLDLRREQMQKNLAFRSRALNIIRNYYVRENFIEVDTPLLVKSTPEGARDYIVPSRVNPGEFYALPQSPQLYKQILMISGFDRYFQIAKCLRDEDLRQDRQPEHSQIDLEMSFVESKDIMNTVEKMMKELFQEMLGIELSEFKVMTYEESMEKYNTDKPDLRKNKEDQKEFAFCWVVDFPLFSKNDDGTWTPEHHMFSSPKKEHLEYLDTDPSKVRGDLFDLVLNGVELASGSIRISNPQLQEKVMSIIGMTKEEARTKFGFLLNAYDYGGPIHGGVGIGLDRLISLMLETNDIREVIAFPKNKSAQCPMDESPSPITTEQLKDVHIALDLPPKKETKPKE